MDSAEIPAESVFNTNLLFMLYTGGLFLTNIDSLWYFNKGKIKTLSTTGIWNILLEC